MTHTNFQQKEFFLMEIREANKKMTELLERIKIATDESGFPLKKDTYHFLTRVLEPSTRTERTLFMLLFHAAYQSELLSSGSSYVSIRFANEFIDKLFKNPQVTKMNDVELGNEFDKILENYKESIRENLTSIKVEKLKESLANICDDPVLFAAIWEAILVSGLEGKIHVEDSTLSNYVVEQKSGYYFNVLKPFKFMLPANNFWEVTDAKVLLIDGIVERVSELDKVLNGALETRIPLLLIAHGFSEEVISTIKMNVDYKKFNIMPVRLAPDLDSLNVINDIAVVSGGDIVSTLKGQMICFVNFDSLPTVEKIRLTTKELCIENAKTRKAVSEHIRMLLEKRQSNLNVSDLCDLIDQRIQSLLSASVTLRLPSMTATQKENTKVKIDITLRTAKTLLNYGEVDFGKLKINSTNNVLSKPFSETLQSMQKDFKTIPALSAYAGIHFAGKNVLPLLTSNGFVKIVSK